MRAHITLENYVDTEEQKIARHIERNKIDTQIHRYYKEASRNVTELSEEKYAYYVVNQTSGEYINKTHYFLIAHVYKQYKDMADFVNNLNSLANELNETYPNKYHFAYVDKNVDPRLAYTFEARAEPSVYLLDPTTGKAYAMDNSYNKTAPGVVKDWILSGDYKKSPRSFTAPKLLTGP